MNNIFTGSGVQLPQHDRGQFHFRHTVSPSQIKSKIENIIVKAEALRINLNIDGTPIASRSHTHPSHTQNSRLLTSSLSLGVPGLSVVHDKKLKIGLVPALQHNMNIVCMTAVE